MSDEPIHICTKIDTIEDIKRRVDILEKTEREDTKILSKVSTLIDMVMDSNQRRDLLAQEQASTLSEISITLAQINESLSNMNQRIGVLEQSDIEGKIDVKIILKNIIFQLLLPTGLTTAIILLILKYFKIS